MFSDYLSVKDWKRELSQSRLPQKLKCWRKKKKNISAYYLVDWVNWLNKYITKN